MIGRRAGGALLVLAGLCACRSRAPGAGDAGAGDAGHPAAVPLASAAKARDAAAPAVDAGALTATDRKALAAYHAAVAEGRKLTRAGHHAEARAAFDRALVARPRDARALAERGYAELLLGDLDAADADLARAEAGALEPKLAAAVHFNRGLLADKRGRTADAQPEYALAVLLEPTPARRAKLVAGAGCTAAITTTTEATGTLHASWEDLARAIEPAQDRGSAKKSVCLRSYTATGDPDEDDVCDGPAPWVLAHHHLMFVQEEWVVVPSGPKLFAVELGAVGAWPAHCTNLPAPTASLVDGLVRLVTEFDGKDAATDEKQALDPETGEPRCVDAQPWRDEQWFDPKAGRGLLRMRTYPRQPIPKVTVTPGALVVTGGGCDRSLPRP